MNAHEHTDTDGDGLTITHDDGRVWITCTSKHTEVTVGPLPADILDSERNPAHDIDWQAVAEQHEGTVGALISELERRRAMAKLWKETARYQLAKIADRDDAHSSCEWDRLEAVHRAEKAEDTLSLVQQQRDQATARAEKAEQERDSWESIAQQTARSIDALRAEQPRPLGPDAIEVALRECMPSTALERMSGTRVMRLAEDMHAALTDPPARPEWDALHAVLSRTPRPATTEELTDVLYAEGVRAPEDGLSRGQS